jgi:hypothetical protein
MITAACWPALAQTAASAPTSAAPWTPAKLPDGQPDVQGYWTAGGTVVVGGKEVPTRGGTYSITGGPLGGGGEAEVLDNDKLLKEGKPLPVWPSKVVDPADGQIPYQPWARAHQKYIEANVDHPTKQEHLDPQERCFLDGPVRDTFHYEFKIEQYPGYVIILHDGYRIIPLEDRPHPSQDIKLWNSDSRGHWEGNTLVVDVANSNSKSRLDRAGNFASDKVHIVERYIFTGPNRLTYEATVEDPSVYTRPWKVSSPIIRTHVKDPNYERWEEECWEGERNIKELSDEIDHAAANGRPVAAVAGQSTSATQ